jgi:hypothetical protein
MDMKVKLITMAVQGEPVATLALFEGFRRL